MENKYELLTDDTIINYYNGVTLYRIKALKDFGNVKKGDLGGYIEKEENLSHEGNCWVGDNAFVFGNAIVCNNAMAFGNARVYGDSKVYDDSKVYGNSRIFDDVLVFEDAEVYGDVIIHDNTDICSNAEISSDFDYCYIKGFGSVARSTTFFKCKDGHIHVRCGCFDGTLNEFENEVESTHGDNKYGREYLAAINMIKIHFDLE